MLGQPGSALLAAKRNALRVGALAVARKAQDKVSVRAPAEELHATRVERVRRERVRGRVRAVDSRVVDVEGRQAFAVFQAEVDVIACEQQACGGDVLQVKA